MSKKISIILAIIAAAFVVRYFNDPWRKIKPSDVYTAIISTDGYISPSVRQDFLVNVFREIDNNRVFETKANLGISFTIPINQNESFTEILPLVYTQPGKYTCNYDFEKAIEGTVVTISVFPERRTDKPIVTCTLPVKKEKAIVVQPPDNQTYIGSKITFKLASVEKKSGLCIPKFPVRVRMTTPSGYTTLNRVVITDTEGLATLETFIHKASPEGYYTFTFAGENFEQKISIYVKEAPTEPTLASLETTPTYVSSEITNENCGFIFNLNCERNDALMAYGCPDSQHRQIEIWQNGKLNYYANLNLEGGTVSLVLHKPLLAGCPVLFKLWQITDNEVISHEKVRYLPFKTPDRLSDFLYQTNAEFHNTEKDRLAMSLARRAFTGVSSKMDFEDLTQIFSQNMRSVFPSPQTEITLQYFENKLIKQEKLLNQSSFELIEHETELDMKKNYKLYLDQSEFLKDYLQAIYNENSNLDSMLQEATCLTELFNKLSGNEKKEISQKLEGLLIPLTEIYGYTSKFPDKKKEVVPSILTVCNKIKECVSLPQEFLFEFSKNAYNLTNEPMLEIKPANRSLQSIQGLFRQAGKAIINNKTASLTIDLQQPSILLPDGYTSFTNTRDLPVVIGVTSTKE